jgi:signal transduction histidine kinase/DNA-binding response OmpR family regulator/ligand-binding sensor domain-containing protein
MNTRTIFITVCVINWSLAVNSQSDYILTPLPTQEQLPVASIHTLLQDREGYMWYATRDGGLCRDNGYSIDVFRSDRFNPTLMGKSNHINALAETQDNRIVFANRDGLYVLDKHDYSIQLVDKDLEGQNVEPVMIAADGTLWASSNKMIYHYDKNLNRIGSYKSIWFGEQRYPCHLMEDSKGNVWAVQWNGGLLRYDRQKDGFVEQYWKEGVMPAYMVEDEVNHCYWVATWGNGIVKYMPDQHSIEFEPCTTKQGELAAQSICMLHDKTLNRLFVSTMYGLKTYDIRDGRLAEVNLTGLLPAGMGITDYMTFDRRGNLWVAGFPPNTFILSLKSKDIERNDFAAVRHLLNDRPVIWNSVREGDYIWFGQDRLLLCLYNTKTSALAFANQAGIRNYLDMNGAKFRKCRTQQGIWSYAAGDVYHIWNEGMNIKAEHIATTGGWVECIYDAGDGNIYIGHQNGIDVYQVANGQIRHLPIKQTKVSDIVKSEDGILYYCSGDRLLKSLDQKEMEQEISSAGDFTSVVIDQQGVVWAADRQGDLLRYDPKAKTATIDEKGSNRKGDYIKRITVDRMGHLWLLTDKEIKEYNPQNGNYRIMAASDPEIQMDYFYNVSADGEQIRIDGAGAIVSIKPLEDLAASSSLVRPMVTAVSVNGKNNIIGIGKHQLDIDADAVNIEIQFSTLNHLNAQKITYAYRLKGIDSQWHYMPQGVNKASFVRLPNGRYTIELMATDEYGSWGEPVEALTLHRLPAWYETWWAYLLYIIIGITLVGYIVWEYLARQKRKQQQQMEQQLTEMKFRFFTNVSHELRTPLTLILTPLQSLRRRLGEVSTETIGTQLALIDTNAQRLLSLVNRLLDFRKLEMGQQKLELSNGDIYEFVGQVCETFRPLSREKSIGLGCAIPNKSLYMNFDKTKMQHIISNLLSNAFKFTPEGGNIAVSVSELPEKKVRLQVSDTGCGINAKDLPHVFERFFQSRSASDTSATGTGIGLNMVQEMVQLQGGTVAVESAVGKGTTFIVTLSTDLRASETPVQISEPAGEIQTETSHNASNILIVDDNDEFRQFLCSELSETYNILQATNGEEALQIVQDNDIDLIVSDVMMPQMDGMELCRRVKQDINTSHMMVILLTARTAEEVKIEGFRAGADDYLSKPFNMEMLQLRISHLLELRRKRNEEFQKGEEVKVEEVALNEIDQKFMNDALAAVEKNMDNEEYDIDAFASDVCMSRSTLYRKIISLTGQKPSEFIRTIRLKHAARLIKEGKHSLTEIGYMCGFSSTSYFYRCFKKQYGVQPGCYQ